MNLVLPNNPKGHIFRLVSGVVVVPFHQEDRDHWTCVVIGGSHGGYPVGGYNIFISHQELIEGEELKLGEV